MLIVGILLVTLSRSQVTAEPKAKSPTRNTAAVAHRFDSGTKSSDSDPFETFPNNAPVDAAAYPPQPGQWDAKQTAFEASAEAPLPIPGEAAQGKNAAQPAASKPKEPCAAANFKPLTQLGISIAQPAGQMPTDFAAVCWQQINAGPNGACRCWPMTCYQWDATCLCYQPLYFEEINAERFGYDCGLGRFGCCTNCLQSAVSAAHFFGTVPALPYCMSAQPPCECVYTLGHYRAGDCVPWRCSWPPCDPFAAVSAGGIYTGLIFAIP